MARRIRLQAHLTTEELASRYRGASRRAPWSFIPTAGANFERGPSWRCSRRTTSPGLVGRRQRRHGVLYSLLQKNVLDRQRWTTRAKLAYAILVWIEHTYNRRRRQRSLGKLTPVEFELAFTAVTEKHRNRRVHGHVRGSLALVASPPSQGSERHRLRRAPLPGRTTTSIPRGVPTTPRPRPSLSPPRASPPFHVLRFAHPSTRPLRPSAGESG
jgi:putative transposase